MTRQGSTRASILVWTAFAAFIVVLGMLMIASLMPREASEFAPSPSVAMSLPDTLFVDTLTVDARDARRWTFVDLERRTVVRPPDTAGWDLALRRFDIIASGPVTVSRAAFNQLHIAPDSAYVATTFENDTINAVLEEWYRYSFTSHLLRPRSNTYVVRTSAGRYAKVEFLGYYCPEMAAGCPTFRYAYQPDGSRTLRTSP